MPYCYYCGSEISAQDVKCHVCGADIGVMPAEKVFCRWCGEKIDEDCIVCPKCGKQVQQPYSSAGPVFYENFGSTVYHNGREISKWVAFMLCLFLGIFGAHKFYEKKIGMGFLYLFTFGLFGIGWFIDMLVILFKPDPYYI